MQNFNLTQEGWVRVLTSGGETEDVSLRDLFKHAHQYTALAGEMPTQDTAILRMLLACLHSIYAKSPPKTKEEALSLWKDLYDQGCFDSNKIDEYFDRYEDRFNLFDAKYPFYQVPEFEKNPKKPDKMPTHFEAKKMIGEIAESGNKARLFSPRSGEEKKRVLIPEAARWLVHLMNYDDQAPKPINPGRPSPGVGHTGKLGSIMAQGSNLFETLMINFTLLKDGEQLWAEKALPLWERETPDIRERVAIETPDNPAQLLTIPSRRIQIVRDGDAVVGYFDSGGEFLASMDNASVEQFTLWRSAKKDVFVPTVPQKQRDLWRDIPNVFFSFEPKNEKSAKGKLNKKTKPFPKKLPGIVKWIETLTKNGLLDHPVQFNTVFMQYDGKKMSITDVFGSSLSLSFQILGDKSVQETVTQEIRRIDRIAYYLKMLEIDCARASGLDKEPTSVLAEETFYHSVDPIFRQWLLQDTDSVEFLHKQTSQIASRSADSLAKRCPSRALTGHLVGDTFYSSAKALKDFERRMYFLDNPKQEETDNGTDNRKEKA